jgi:hypothetical protein
LRRTSTTDRNPNRRTYRQTTHHRGVGRGQEGETMGTLGRRSRLFRESAVRAKDADRPRDSHEGGDDEEADEREERWEWFQQSRMDADAPPPRDLILQASRQRRVTAAAPDSAPTPPGGPGGVNWTPLGPSVVAHGQASGYPAVSGRITALAVGPAGNRAYAGAANGGVWFTADAGATWAPLDDYFASPSFVAAEADALSVGAVAVRFGASAATDEIYVGTGEPNGSLDSYFGVGIRHSSAGGAPGTWTLEATNLAGSGIYRIVIDPDDPTRVYGATTRGLFQRPAAAPFTTWTLVAPAVFTNPNGLTTDVIVAGTGAARRFYVVFQGDRAYRFDLTSWTALTGTGGSNRVVLAAGESDPTAVYALGQMGQLYRLAGTTFQAVGGMPPLFNGAGGGQGWYDIALAVDPANAATVYLIGDLVWDGEWTLSVYKGTLTSSGGTWTFPFNAANAGNPVIDPTWIGRGVHADGHAVAFALNAAGTAHDGTNVWIGTDGGVFQSSASGALATFKARNDGLAITEMTYVAQRADTDAVVFGGCQDNGTVRFWGTPTWYEAPQGDGGGVAADPNDPYRVMREYVRASLAISTDGGSSGAWSGLNFPPITASTTTQRNAAATESNATNFYATIAATPPGTSPTLAAFGTNRVWLTPDWGTTWTTLPTGTNPYVPATPNAAQDVLDASPVEDLSFASGTRLYAATRAAVWRFDLSGTTWTRTALPTTGLPASRFITAIAPRDATSGDLYAVLGRSGVAHVWYFDAAASTWRDAQLRDGAGNAIDVPTHAVVVDPDNPNTVYVGTDVGVWRGTKTGATAWTWTVFSAGLPEAVISDLAIHRPSRLLRAGTHGRGVWEIELDAAAGRDVELYLRVDAADTGRIVGGARRPYVEGAQDPTRPGFQAWHWQCPDIRVRRPSLGGLPTLPAQPDFLDFDTKVGDYVDSGNTETADQAATNKVFVMVHNRGLTALPAGTVRVLLLMTDASAGLPALPSDLSARINANDTSNWLAGTNWQFATPGMPYRTTTGSLDARTPQVVEFDVDLSTITLASGSDHVCLAAFVTTTTTADQFATTQTSLDALTMQDRHAAHRNLHLVPAGARPIPAEGRWRVPPVTVVLDLHNAARERERFDLLIDRRALPGELTLMLPRGVAEHVDVHQLAGFRPETADVADVVRQAFGRLLHVAGEAVEEGGRAIERLGDFLEGRWIPDDRCERHRHRIVGLDRARMFRAGPVPAPMVTGLDIPAGGRLPVGLMLALPADARPGDRFHFDVIQRRDGKVVGGGTYVVAVVEERGDT